MPTSTARHYFEQYTAEGALALLQSLPTTNPKVVENEWLDFKSGKAIFNMESLSKIWSKALGAFANNEGGVVIFGIDARPDSATGIDAANAVEPVADVNWLISKLTELSRFAVDPPPVGIEYRALPLKNSATDGFVVCLIPEGTQKPYRSELVGKRFFVRMGDSAQEPTVSLLRQLFYTKNKPSVTLVTTPVHDANLEKVMVVGEDASKFVLIFKFTNSGTMTIDHCCISIEPQYGKRYLWYYEEGERFPSQELFPAVKIVKGLFHPRLSTSMNLFFAFSRSTGVGLITVEVYGNDFLPLKAVIDPSAINLAVTQTFDLVQE